MWECDMEVRAKECKQKLYNHHLASYTKIRLPRKWKCEEAKNNNVVTLNVRTFGIEKTRI